MQTLNLTAWNNQIFRLTLPMDNWVGVLDLSACKLIAFVKQNQADKNYFLGFSSYGAEGCAGTLLYIPSTKKLVFYADEEHVTALSGDYFYDALADDGTGRVGLFGGGLHFNIGVTT